MPSLVGNKPNQVPTNGDLGTLAFQDANAVNIQGGIVDVSAGSATVASFGAAGDENTGLFFPAADTIAVTTGGTERVRVDSSGNVGVGVTPSAWLSSARSLEVSGYASFATWNNASGVVNNGFYNASSQWIYKNTAAASAYYQVSGQHIWQTAPSGTAGNAITLTERMRITETGNVGIGTASPAARLHATGTGTTQGILQSGDNTTVYLRLINSTNNLGYLGYTGDNIVLLTGGTERVRIDTGGRLGLGTASPSELFHAYNANTAISINEVASGGSGVASSRWKYSTNNYGIYVGSVNAMVFYDYGANAERMRIDSTGKLGVATNSPTATLDVNADTVRVRTARTPASATAAGNAGDICWDANYVYVCVATNTWKRAALSTW